MPRRSRQGKRGGKGRFGVPAQAPRRDAGEPRRGGSRTGVTESLRRRDGSAAAVRSSWPILLILGAGALAYWNSFDGAFVFDDNVYVLNKDTIKSLDPISDILSTRRPVLYLSLAFNYAADKFDPWGYHLVNLVIHLLAGLTLFGIVRRTLEHGPWRDVYVRRSAWIAGTVALLWVVHPLQTQSVTYIVQRSESMMGLFYLLTLYCAIRGATGKSPWRWTVLAASTCALGMGCKAVMVTAPLIVLLYDRTFLARSFGAALRKRRVLYAALAATWTLLVTTGVARAVLFPKAEASPTVGFGFRDITWVEYAVSQPGVILRYLKLAVLPTDLCLDYGWPVARGMGEIVPPLIVVAALLCVTGWALWRRSWLGFVGAWFFLILAPTSSFIPIKDLAFEHRMYLPLAACIAAVVVGAYFVLNKLAERWAWDPTRFAKACALIIVAVAVPLTYGTIRRNEQYVSEEAIWRDVIAKRPNNFRAYHNLGSTLESRDDTEWLDESIGYLNDAIRLEPTWAMSHQNLGWRLVQKGLLDEGMASLREALRLDPEHKEAKQAQTYLADALSRKGEHAEAQAILDLLGALPPDANSQRDAERARTHFRVGNAFALEGNEAAAVEAYRQAVTLDPELEDGYYNLGLSLRNLGRIDEAIDAYHEAIRVGEPNPRYHIMLGNALTDQHRREEAMEEYRVATLIEGPNVDRADIARAHFNLGNGLIRGQRYEEAIESYLLAIGENPDYAKGHFALGWTYERLGELDYAVDAFAEALRIDPSYVEAQRGLVRVQDAAGP